MGKSEITFGEDESGQFVRYDEKLSKNYRVSLNKYQEEHFRLVVTSHDMDMVCTLKSLISHLPVSGTFLFYQCIDNPRTHAWYSTLRMSSKRLIGFMRDLHQECGLVTDFISNKTGRTTCVTRMASKGVPPTVGMRITGHKLQGAYSRYDRSLEVQVRAAQKCIGEGSAYAGNFIDETLAFKQKAICGERKDKSSDEVEGKKPRLDINGVPAIEMCLSEAMSETHSACNATEGSVLLQAAVSEEPNLGLMQEKEDEWMEVVDWDNVMAEYDRNTTINPITTIFGKIASMSGCTVNISIGSFNSK